MQRRSSSKKPAIKKEESDATALHAYATIDRVMQLALQSSDPAVRAMGQNAVEAGNWLVKDRETLRNPTRPEYKKGQEVFYKMKAEIVKVYEDPGGGPPYFDVRLGDENKTEKQTVAERLCPL